MADRDTLIAWLRDAHAMEKQAIDMMEAHAGRLQHYPDLKAKIEAHISETKEQARRLEGALKHLGADTSALKTGLARATSMLQAIMGSMTQDEVVKNAMGEYSFEHFEISAYRCLIAAAEACNEPEVKRACEQNLQEEQAMAQWLEQHLPALTKQYLGLVQTLGAAEAKR